MQLRAANTHRQEPVYKNASLRLDTLPRCAPGARHSLPTCAIRQLAAGTFDPGQNELPRYSRCTRVALQKCTQTRANNTLFPGFVCLFVFCPSSTREFKMASLGCVRAGPKMALGQCDGSRGDIAHRSVRHARSQAAPSRAAAAAAPSFVLAAVQTSFRERERKRGHREPTPLSTLGSQTPGAHGGLVGKVLVHHPPFLTSSLTFSNNGEAHRLRVHGEAFEKGTHAYRHTHTVCLNRFTQAAYTFISAGLDPLLIFPSSPDPSPTFKVVK